MRFCYLFFAILIFSCNKPIADGELNNLNGYWEISKVIMADGSYREYKINETVEHIQIGKTAGIRKKLKPRFDGTYAETGLIEEFAIVREDDRVLIKYSTEMDSWSEEIITLTKDELVVRASENEYHYRRPVPFNIE